MSSSNHNHSVKTIFLFVVLAVVALFWIFQVVPRPDYATKKPLPHSNQKKTTPPKKMPSFRVKVDKVYLPGRKITIDTPISKPFTEAPKIKIEHSGLKEAKINFYSIDKPLEFLLEQKDMSNPSIKMEPKKDKRFIFRGSIKFAFKTEEKNGTKDIEEEIELPITNTGLYLIEVHSEGSVAWTTLLVSYLKITAKRIGDNIVAMVADRRTKKPAKGVSVHICHNGKIVNNGITGEDGSFKTKVSVKENVIVSAIMGKNFAVFDLK